MRRRDGEMLDGGGRADHAHAARRENPRRRWREPRRLRSRRSLVMRDGGQAFGGGDVMSWLKLDADEASAGIACRD